MKKLIFPAVAALTMGLASCSSDEVNPGNGGGTVNYAEGGYVRLSINMPSTKGTRAANDDFNDGLAREYAVKNATLILFHGATSDKEADLKFHSAYKLTTGMEMVGDATDQITSMTKIVEKTDDKSHSGKLCALVVLNDNGAVKVTDGNNLSLDNGATNFSGDFSKFSKTLSEIAPITTPTKADEYVPAPKFASNVAENGIFMTNAPLSEVAGNTNNPKGANVTTLVDVTKSVYHTEKEAQNSPAADIFVERGVAKVTFSMNDSEGKDGNSYLSGDEFQKTDNKMQYEIVGWNLDVTNQSSYLVRQISNANFGLFSSDFKTSSGNKFRFVGSEPIVAQTGGATTTTPSGGSATTTTNTKNFYRIYWAEDPNYNTFIAPFNTGTATGGKEEFNRLANNPALSSAFGDNNPQYCYENTFNVDNQKQDQTTRVVIAIRLRFAGETYTNASAYPDLYAFNGDRSKLYNETGVKTRIQNAIKNVLQEKEGFSSLAATSINVDDIVLTSRDPKTGEMAVSSFKAPKTTTTGTTTETFDAASAEVRAVNTEIGKITMYEHGLAYYAVRIKHFGDDSTPWNVGTQGVTAGDQTANTYPGVAGVAGQTQNDRFLGRYGVLRNNWYNLSVGKVAGLGSPTIPSTENIPDDELYNYISVRINILSWAKRTQHEDL